MVRIHSAHPSVKAFCELLQSLLKGERTEATELYKNAGTFSRHVLSIF